MKRLMIVLVLAIAGLTIGQTKVGSTAAPFLNIGVGARAVSMGGAFSATASDVTALYWNPAGVANSLQSGAMFSNSQWFADIKMNWAGAALQLGGMGTIGLSVTQLDYGDMEVTTLQEPEGTGEMFNAQDLSLGLTYAMRLTEQFSIGGSVKYVSQSIWNSSVSGFAVDLGVLFISDINGLRIGAAITNFGTDMQIDGKDLLVLHDVDEENFGNNDQILASLQTNEYPLPLTFKVGLAMDLIDLADHRFTVAADAYHPSDNAEYLSVGGEYMFMNLLALRGGYKSLFLDNSEEGLTLGFGIHYELYPGFALLVDYAYQDFGVLDETQHFSFGVKF